MCAFEWSEKGMEFLMNNMVLNETPIRTSKNFNINNVMLEDFELKDSIEDFKNVKISNESSKIYFSTEPLKFDLKYGVSDGLTKQVNNKSNFRANVLIDSKTNKDIQINFKLDKNNTNLVDAIGIVANENTKATVVIKYDSEKNVSAYHNGIITVKAEKNAVINVIIINYLNEKSNNFLSLQNNILDSSKINYYIVDFGGKNSITNYYSNIGGTEAENRLNTLYIGSNEQFKDLNYIAELYGEKSGVNIEVQGALNDKAKKHFKGTIDFKKGCKKATGNENENCILLSDKAKSIALPMLLCSEEDVEGNHSTSSGKVAEKELFYIMSRGFEKKDALRLLVKAKFNKILQEIKNEEIRAELLDEIDKRII